MSVLRVISVILSVQAVWSLSEIEEKYFISQLTDYFDEESIEISFSQKRDAAAVSNEQNAALIAANGVPDRATHYWTRKRGRERENTQNYIYPLYYSTYPTQPVTADMNSESVYSRKKREALRKLNQLKALASREKRQAEVEAEVEDVAAEMMDEGQNKTTNLVANEPAKNVTEMSEVLGRGKNRDRGMKIGRRFGKKLHRCCEEEAELPAFNQTILNARAECMRENGKNMRRSNDSEGNVTGDGGLYNFFSCDRINRWKTFAMCTVDCMAMKLGVITPEGSINLDTAKRIFQENFATRSWEQETSSSMVEKCSQSISKTNNNPIDAFGLKCNSKAAEFVYCLWRELFLICPADKQQKNRQCEKLRGVLQKYDDNKFQK